MFLSFKFLEPVVLSPQKGVFLPWKKDKLAVAVKCLEEDNLVSAS